MESGRPQAHHGSPARVPSPTRANLAASAFGTVSVHLAGRAINILPPPTQEALQEARDKLDKYMDGNVQLVDPQSLNAAWMYGSTLQVPGRHVLMAATLQAQKDDEAAAMEKALEGETSDDEESAKDACEAMLDVLESVNGRIEHLDDVRSVERRRTREITQAAQVVLSHHYHEVQRQTRFSVQGAPCDIEDVTLCE